MSNILEMVKVEIMCDFYKLMRPLLVAAVHDPDKKWDDYLMWAADGLFHYERKDGD